MLFVAVLIGVVALGALAVWALRRRGTDELHSVRGYQHRLERLEEVRRRQTGSVRIVGGTSQRQEPPPSPMVGEGGRLEIPSPQAPRRVFDDTAEVPRHRQSAPAPAPYRRRRRDVSIARMSHRPRRLGAPIAAAVAVIVLVTGLAIAGAHSRGGHATPTTTHAHDRRTTTPTTAHPTTTTSTVPKTFTVSSVSGGVATYSIPFASYSIVFKGGSADCYVQVTTANGMVPYAQDLQAGGTEKLSASGTTQVVLGAPSYVSIAIDGTPVTFPTPLEAPLDITFQAPAGAGTGTTTTTAP